MMLQILKVVFIRGSWVTTAMAIMIWLDWAAVQYCQLWIWFYPDKEEVVWRPLYRQDHLESTSIPSLGRGVDFLDDRLRRTMRFLGSAMVVGSNCVQLGWAAWKTWEYSESLYLSYRLLLHIPFVIFVLVLTVMFVCLLDPTFTLTTKALSTSFVSFCSFVWILVYYKFLYSDVRTYKPQWLNWLG
jgi:hypothetical protein